METRASYLLVGAFVLALMAGLVGFVVWLTKVELERRGDLYYIYFSGSVTGLQEGSPVRYAGIPVGAVSDIRIAPENVSLVRVTVELEEGAPVKEDSIASLELQGLTGTAYVQISGGTQSSPPLKAREGDIAVIRSRPSTLAELADVAPQVLNRVVELADKLSNLLNERNQLAIAETLTNLSTLTGELAVAAAGARQAMTTLDTFAGEARGHAETLARDAGQTLTQVRQTLSGVQGDADTLTAETRDLARSLRKASDQLSGLVAESRRPIRDFTEAGLYDLTLLVGELRDLVGSLSRVTTRIERDPAGFFLGGARRGEEVQ